MAEINIETVVLRLSQEEARTILWALEVADDQPSTGRTRTKASASRLADALSVHVRDVDGRSITGLDDDKALFEDARLGQWFHFR